MGNPSYPAAVDWLVTNLRSAAQAVVPTAVVSDGIPTEESDDEIVVGLTPVDDESDGDHALVDFGEDVEESYQIPIEFTSWRGGSSQKTARDACAVLVNAAVAKIRADRTLGGTVGPYPVEFGPFSWVPTSESIEGSEGRRQSCLFSVQVTNHF